MKKFFNASISFLLVLSLFSFFNLPIQAIQSTYNVSPQIQNTSELRWSAEAKKQFASEMNIKYTQELAAGNIKSASSDEINDLILQCSAADDEERNILIKELEKYGVYRLEPTERIERNSAQSVKPESADVTVEEPLIFLFPWNNYWAVSCGGHWNNNKWHTSSLGTDVGDADAFGVSFTNISGQYRSIVTNSSAWITDENEEKKTTTTNRSDGNGDGSLGFGFRMQDYMYNKSWIADDKAYVGYKWSGCVTYDDWFGSYNFTATVYYVHTYDKAIINSIEFGVLGGQAGLNIQIQNVSQSFKALSNNTRFAIGEI